MTETKTDKTDFGILVVILLVHPFLVKVNVTHKTEYTTYHNQDAKVIVFRIGQNCKGTGKKIANTDKTLYKKTFDISLLTTHYYVNQKQNRTSDTR
jgi:hypothetical protein